MHVKRQSTDNAVSATPGLYRLNLQQICKYRYSGWAPLETMKTLLRSLVGRLNWSPMSVPGVAWRRGPWRAALIGLVAMSPAPAKEAVVWIESYDEALAEARKTGKPIFLEFRCAP